MQAFQRILGPFAEMQRRHSNSSMFLMWQTIFFVHLQEENKNPKWQLPGTLCVSVDLFWGWDMLEWDCYYVCLGVGLVTIVSTLHQSILNSESTINQSPTKLGSIRTTRASIFKRLWSPEIDSKERIPPAYVAWRAGTITLFLYLGV